jgi:hypothetical protein
MLLQMRYITNINFTRYQYPTMEIDIVTHLLYTLYQRLYAGGARDVCRAARGGVAPDI